MTLTNFCQSTRLKTLYAPCLRFSTKTVELSALRLPRGLFFFGMVGFWAVDPETVDEAKHLVQAT
jgi:hypothetical protein